MYLNKFFFFFFYSIKRKPDVERKLILKNVIAAHDRLLKWQ